MLEMPDRRKRTQLTYGPHQAEPTDFPALYRRAPMTKPYSKSSGRDGTPGPFPPPLLRQGKCIGSASSQKTRKGDSWELPGWGVAEKRGLGKRSYNLWLLSWTTLNGPHVTTTKIRTMTLRTKLGPRFHTGIPWKGQNGTTKALKTEPTLNHGPQRVGHQDFQSQSNWLDHLSNKKQHSAAFNRTECHREESECPRHNPNLLTKEKREENLQLVGKAINRPQPHDDPGAE